MNGFKEGVSQISQNFDNSRSRHSGAGTPQFRNLAGIQFPLPRGSRSVFSPVKNTKSWLSLVFFSPGEAFPTCQQRPDLNRTASLEVTASTRTKAEDSTCSPETASRSRAPRRRSTRSSRPPPPRRTPRWETSRTCWRRRTARSSTSERPWSRTSKWSLRFSPRVHHQFRV